MNFLYIICGIIVVLFGVWQTVYTAKKIAQRGVGILGADIQILGVGNTCIICGIIVIVQHI